MTDITVLSRTKCTLGEGPLWHPERGTFFWFDIMGRKLFEHDGEQERHWEFDRCVSAAGWVDRSKLLVATARDLVLFDVETGQEEHVIDMEADNPATRSNDGRADPYGGFWIGTMGYELEEGAGAFYRFYKGELRQLFPSISIPNATCFAPDGRTAFFTDTTVGVIRRVALDGEGWPDGEPEDWLDLDSAGLRPDGAVIDAEGNLWCAQYGHSVVTCYDPSGSLLRTVDLPTPNITCPAFGGPGLTRLFATSAGQNRPPEDTHAGCTFAVDLGVKGQAEHQVTL